MLKLINSKVTNVPQGSNPFYDRYLFSESGNFVVASILKARKYHIFKAKNFVILALYQRYAIHIINSFSYISAIKHYLYPCTLLLYNFCFLLVMFIRVFLLYFFTFLLPPFFYSLAVIIYSILVMKGIRPINYNFLSTFNQSPFLVKPFIKIE